MPDILCATQQRRIADALERIADALEKQNAGANQEIPAIVSGEIVTGGYINCDGVR